MGSPKKSTPTNGRDTLEFAPEGCPTDRQADGPAIRMQSMRPPRAKFTIRRLMIAVAILAPFLMALREGAEGSLLAGIVIVVACVVILARKLTVEAIANRSRWEKAGAMAEGSHCADFLGGRRGTHRVGRSRIPRRL